MPWPERTEEYYQKLGLGSQLLAEVKEGYGLLRKRFYGKVPFEFARQAVPQTGLCSDYMNNLPAIHILYIFTHPDESDMSDEFLQTLPDCIRRNMRGSQTYTEYYREKIRRYNASAPERGYEAVEPQEALQVMVLDIPEARRLDEIALGIRTLERQNSSIVDLIEPVVRLVTEADDLISGKNRKEGVLRSFGYQP